MTKNAQLGIILALLAIGIMFRLMPHPPNFAPITALALFGGALLPKKKGLWLPLGAMVLSDLIIGLHSLILVTWGSFFLIAFYAQKRLKGRMNGTNLFATVVGSSVFFFLVTNFGVWLQGHLYPRTLTGLTNSYVSGLPFFRNTLLGDLFFSGVFFGAYFLAVRMIAHWRPQLVRTS